MAPTKAANEKHYPIKTGTWADDEKTAFLLSIIKSAGAKPNWPSVGIPAGRTLQASQKMLETMYKSYPGPDVIMTEGEFVTPSQKRGAAPVTTNGGNANGNSRVSASGGVQKKTSRATATSTTAAKGNGGKAKGKGKAGKTAATAGAGKNKKKGMLTPNSDAEDSGADDEGGESASAAEGKKEERKEDGTVKMEDFEDDDDETTLHGGAEDDADEDEDGETAV